MSSRAETQLPHSVREQWAALLNHLPADWRARGETLIRSYLPPPSIEALKYADWLYRNDFGDLPPVSGDWSTVLSGEDDRLVQKVPSHIKVPYPLFAYLYKIFHPNPSADDRGYKQARSLLIRYLADLEAPQADLSPGAYYDDALAFRRCLETLDKANRLSNLPDKPDLSDLLRELDGLPEHGQKEDQGPSEKIARLRTINEGDRYLGTRQFNRRSSNTTTSKLPRRELTRATPGSRNKQQRNHRKAGESPRNEASRISLDGRDYQRKPNPNRSRKASEPTDPDSPDLIERSEPSTLTPADDWATVRRMGGMPPTAPVVALTDPTTLPDSPLAAALTAVSDTDDVAWAWAWLVVTTGLPPRRLAQLTRSSGEDVPDQSPRWHPHQRVLRFLLLDGPSAADASTGYGNQIIHLPLPAIIQTILEGVSHPQPLEGAPDRTRAILTKAFRKTPGPHPRLSRLRGTAWSYKIKRARDPVAAAMLGGEFGAGLAAQAAYRQIDRTELTHLYKQVSTDLADRLSACSQAGSSLRARLAEITFEDTQRSEAGFVGSWRTQAWDGFALALEQIREVCREAGYEANTFRGKPAEEAKALQQAVNAQALYAYLGWLIATAARPIGPKTTFLPLEWGWFLSDKASRRYQEVRLMPPIEAIQRQQDRVDKDRERVLDHLRVRGWDVAYHRPLEQRFLPAVISMPSKNRVRVQALHQPVFEDWMQRLDLSPLAPAPANAPRHTMATFLRGRLPASMVDAFLGHHGYGADRQGPATTAALTDWAPLQNLITQALDRVGFQPLAVSEFWNGGNRVG